jgi:uncharacterized protein YbbC (DUF1343 family)
LAHSKISIQEISRQYKVHYNTISDINRCKTWSWLHNYKNNIRKEEQGSVSRGELGTNKINEEQALKIINLLENSTISIAQISRDLNISLYIIYDINRCRTWTYLHNYKNNIRNECKKKGGDDVNED